MRGGWLTTLLAIMTVANVLTALVYSLVVLGVLALPGRAPWVGQALLFLVGTNVICLIALWHWRKWGLYGLGGTALVTFVLNLSLGHTFSGAALGLIGFALITATVSFKWKCFR